MNLNLSRRQFLVHCGATACGVATGDLMNASESTHQRDMSTSSSPRIRYEKVRLPLAHTWAIARGATDFKDNVFVYYERDGLTGIGEAGHLTAAGQTAEQTMQGVERLMPLYREFDPAEYFDLPDAAAKVDGASPPAQAAMEMALLDWLGKKRSLPLYQMLGLNPHKRIPTSFSIGLDRLEVMRQKAREASAYHILKIKLGREDDEAIIQALRKVTDKPIRVDANEGWPDKEIAIRKIDWLAKQGVELVEQPLPRRMVEETRWLKERSPLPLIADEAVHRASDIPVIASAYSGINIKIMKAGGILGAWRMFVVAQAHHLDAMLGCMIESSVGITAAAHLQSLARWVDLDGNLLLQRDPFTGATFSVDGWVNSNRPGLGVTTTVEPDQK